MILVQPKFADIPPFGFQEDSSKSLDGGTPWTHLQILGGRQLVMFGADGNVLGTLDLALTREVKIIRQGDIVAYEVDGADIHVLHGKPPAPVLDCGGSRGCLAGSLDACLKTACNADNDVNEDLYDDY